MTRTPGKRLTENGRFVRDWIRKNYPLPNVDLGQRVVAIGKPGRIVNFADGYVIVRPDDGSRDMRCHPTWEMQYEPAGGER